MEIADQIYKLYSEPGCVLNIKKTGLPAFPIRVIEKVNYMTTMSLRKGKDEHLITM